VKLAGFAILGGINWIPKWYRPTGPFTSTEISEQMSDFYLRGLRGGGDIAEEIAAPLKQEHGVDRGRRTPSRQSAGTQ
jgi:hypothetical protein